MTTMQTDRLILTPISKDHITERYVAWLNDKEVNKYLETRGNYSIERLTDYIENLIIQKKAMWAIHLKESNKHIGNIKIDPINIKHGYGEYGILIGDKHEWGKGFAREASKRVIDYFFHDDFKLRKITLGVVADNTDAMSLYRNLGFIIEGVYKNHVIYDNIYYDVVRMALFNPEYFYDK